MTHSEFTALAIFSCCALFDAFAILMSDPGSELMSAAVAQVNKWFGIHHRLFLVDRDESNGAKGGNTSKLCERIKNKGSAHQHVCWILFIMNKYDQSQYGRPAYDLTFGTVLDRRFDFPSETLDRKQVHNPRRTCT
jgi:hypothetical protein